MNKKIACINAESGQITDLELPPGTTAGDALRQMGVQGDRSITTKPGEAPLEDDDNLYAAVEDGAKVWLSTPISVAL